MYKKYDSLNLPAIDAEILKFWEQEQIFEKSVSQRAPENSFVFYEGPPSANGKPGIHHVMARTVKDLFCRYQTLNGNRVERKGGWDTHGLPIELQVEKELGITKEDIGKSVSVDDYNAACRQTVMRYKDLWEAKSRKMGFWLDLENAYITFNNDYIESVWWLLKRLYDKRTDKGDSYLFKGFTIQPYSPAAGTGLSTHELNMPGCYKEVTDTSVVAMFKVRKNDRSAFLFDSETEDVRILAWTTTPWTLPSNVALTVGPNINYVKVKTFSPYTGDRVSVILAKDRMGDFFPKENDALPFADYKLGDKKVPFNIDMAAIKGSQLVDIQYEQLLPSPEIVSAELAQNGFRVIAGDWVTTEDGTGVVHTAPYFGADDFRAAKAAGIPFIGLPNEKNADLPLPLVDKQGRFVAEVPIWGGRFVKEEYYSNDERAAPDFKPTDLLIALFLKENNKAFNVKKYAHNYPHCWRTDKPVLYYPLDSWFVRASAARERMAELNKTINWKPESTGTGRFGTWLDNLQDWNLSRSRYWGIPLPIWTGKYSDAYVSAGGHEPHTETGWMKSNLYPRTQEQVFAIGSFEQLQKHGYILKRDELIRLLEDSNSAFVKKVVEVNRLREEQRPKFTLTEDSSVLDVDFPDGSFTLEPNIHYENILNLSKQRVITAEDIASANFNGNLLSEFDLIEPVANKSISEFDLHRPYIDDVVLIFKDDSGDNFQDGKLWVRESDLIDVWFDSGSMPYAQWHYPFENAEKWAQNYPADFIAEGVDQTRGWFYTLHAIAVMCFDSVAFKNVVSNGLVLDKEGNKMSKSKGNVVDPFETLNNYGADATRWYMIANANPWDNLKFDEGGILEVRNKYFGTLFNIYQFFATYANIDGWAMDEANLMPYSERSELDRWVISKLYSLVADYRAAMDDYEPTRAARVLENFVDEHLSNWYVRLSRRRFWKSESNTDKEAAYQTLFECLMVVNQLSASLAPFFSEWLYRNLTGPIRQKAIEIGSPLRHESVHLTDLTQPDSSKMDVALEHRMDYAQRLTSLVLSIRKRPGVAIRVRQPIGKMLLPILDESFIHEIEGVKDLVLAETNVKSIEFITDASGLISKKAKANFKTLGAKLGKDMKAAAELIATFSNDDINELEKSGSRAVILNGNSYTLTPEDLLVSTDDLPGWQVANDGALTVALDLHLTDELLAEGTARELVNRIQNLRKESDFNVSDRISVKIERHEAILEAVSTFGEYIKNEVLANTLELVETVSGEKIELFEGVDLGMEVNLN